MRPRADEEHSPAVADVFLLYNNRLRPLVDLIMRQLSLTQLLLSLLVALPLGYGLLYPQLMRCQFVSRSDKFVAFTKPEGKVYVSRLSPVGQQQRFLTNLKQARIRIRQFWGNPQGKAVLIYCPTQAQYEKYCAGGEGAGCSLGTPWGNSFLVLGPEGNNPDVIAHELCHDELFARLGWLTVKREVPQWFNEGLAMMLDYRFSVPTDGSATGATDRYRAYRDEWQYRTQGKTNSAQTLDQLETTHNFFVGDYHDIMLAYMRSGLEVSRWLSVAGQPALLKLAGRLAEGEAFKTAYHQLELPRRSSQRADSVSARIGQDQPKRKHGQINYL